MVVVDSQIDKNNDTPNPTRIWGVGERQLAFSVVTFVGLPAP